VATSSCRYSCRRRKSIASAGTGGSSRRHPQGALPAPHQGLPAVRELFQRLIADGRQIALASSAKENELAQYKKIANIVDLIDAETSTDDAEKSKPHPDIFQAALARLADKNPDRAIVVGDTPYDAEAAAKAGLRTIGLLCGGWSEEEELRRAGCLAVFKDPADLLARYSQSLLGSQSSPAGLQSRS
jgi:HAD superfamily hydrolase (TIGR01509 family)